MKTLSQVKKYVLENQPFSYDELKHMNANVGSITLLLAEKLGISPREGSGNVNELAIADTLYNQHNQYMAETTTEPKGEPVPVAEFALGQTVYYLSEDSIITSRVESIQYRTSIKPNHYQSGFTYWSEYGQLPEKIFATKSELVMDLLGDSPSNLCSEVFMF